MYSVLKMSVTSKPINLGKGKRKVLWCHKGLNLESHNHITGVMKQYSPAQGNVQSATITGNKGLCVTQPVWQGQPKEPEASNVARRHL